jgi:hypothetical protein
MKYRHIRRAIIVKCRPLRLLVWLVLLAGGAALMTSEARAAVDACCVITAIDPASGLVTAREEAVGRGFQFKLNEAGLLGSLHVGQPVYANYARRLVSLDGSSACGRIVTLESLTQATQGGASAARGAPQAVRAGAASGTGGATANTTSSPGATTAQSSKPADEKKADDTGDKVKKEIKNQLKKRLRFP